MDRPVELIPLLCPHCQTPIPASPGEVAWVCEQCSNGWSLDQEKGLLQLDVHYQTGIPQGEIGKPFWVVEANVNLDRNVYGYGNTAQEVQGTWGKPRRFFVPAFDCSLETLISLGPALLRHPPALQEGPPARFNSVTLPPADLQPMLEFIVMAVEAERSDSLKSLQISMQLSPPVLWILP